MVRFTKISIITIIIGVGILFLLLSLIGNTLSARCQINHTKIENLQCFYESDICNDNEVASTIEDVNGCVYPADTFLNQKTIWWLIGGTIGGSSFMFMFYFILKNVSKSDNKFREKDKISPMQAMESFAYAWSKRYGIQIIDDDYKKGAFRFYKAGFPSTKYREAFYKFQVEILEGTYQGIFTIVTSLSKGVSSILNWDFAFDEVLIDDFKFARDWPIAVPEDPTEQRLDRLFEINPERASRLQEELIESNIKRPTPNISPQTQGQPELGEEIQQPYVRQQYQRRYPRRRYYR
jgi:hypothetical protein